MIYGHIFGHMIVLTISLVNLLNLFSLAIEIAEQFNLLPLVTAIQIIILIADIM